MLRAETWVPCPPTANYDLSATAALHSQLSGVLAAFAFAALTFLLTPLQGRAPWRRAQEQESAHNHLVVTLLVAFLCLVVTTFMFSVLAGERDAALTNGRAATEELLSAVAFAISALLLLYAVFALVELTGLRETADEVRAIVVIVVPALAATLVGLSAEDVAQAQVTATARKGADGVLECVASSVPDAVGASVGWLTGAMVGLGIVLVGLSRTVLKGRFPGFRSVLLRNLYPKVGAGVVVLLAVWSTSTSGTGTQVLSSAGTWAVLASCTVALVASMVVFLWADPGTTSAPTALTDPADPADPGSASAAAPEP